MEQLVIGNSLEKIKCESFKDPAASRIRVRPVERQGLQTNLLIECSSKERMAHPVGTQFITESVKVCKKTDGRIYLRAKGQKIIKL